jgi:2-polyprenyl-3-methyl-5-hydroxy-6-metoxy-1,4-benzoquinol methylase
MNFLAPSPARTSKAAPSKRDTSVNTCPAAILIQASSRTWGGGRDRCLLLLDGRPLLLHTLERARELFPDAPIHIVAPGFDRGGLDTITAKVDRCSASYGFDDKPLKRMTEVTRDLPDESIVLRIDGQHSFFQASVIFDLLDAAAAEDLDVARSPDDFPPPLTGDVWRVGALRQMDALLARWPSETAAPHYVHPKYLAMRKVSGLRSRTVKPRRIGDKTLRTIRSDFDRALVEDHMEVNGQSIAAGDQLTFHYVLACGHLAPSDRVLDIACGKGYGGNMLAEVASSVTCADLDDAKLEEGRNRFPRENLVFVREDIMKTRFADASFDVVTSMETIEHVDDVSACLAELHRLLKPGGRAILSTPQSSIGHIPLTPSHVHEFSLAELRSHGSERFEIEKVIGLKAGTIHFDDDPVGSNSMIFLRKALV